MRRTRHDRQLDEWKEEEKGDSKRGRPLAAAVRFFCSAETILTLKNCVSIHLSAGTILTLKNHVSIHLGFFGDRLH